MEAVSTLLGLPPPRRPSLFPSSPYSLITSTTSRGTFLAVNAEPPADGVKGQSPDEPSASAPPPPKKQGGGSGAGFGGSVSDSKRKRQSKERSSVVRRLPVERPSLFPAGKEGPSLEEEQKQGANESAFLITWLGLGIVILVEGIALAASGFLPDEWDNFFVKYLYPSFTPTVFLFVGGSVAYGVIKYLEGEKMKS